MIYSRIQILAQVEHSSTRNLLSCPVSNVNLTVGVSPFGVLHSLPMGNLRSTAIVVFGTTWGFLFSFIR